MRLPREEFEEAESCPSSSVFFICSETWLATVSPPEIGDAVDTLPTGVRLPEDEHY